jgi:hypothetical protein
VRGTVCTECSGAQRRMNASTGAPCVWAITQRRCVHAHQRERVEAHTHGVVCFSCIHLRSSAAAICTHSAQHLNTAADPPPTSSHHSLHVTRREHRLIFEPMTGSLGTTPFIHHQPPHPSTINLNIAPLPSSPTHHQP